MCNSKLLFLSLTILCLTTILSGQNYTINLWPDGVPMSINDTSYHEFSKDNNGWFRIGKVTDPTITVYLPENCPENTPAVLICPGGGYARLAMDHEGTEVAEWLNSIGIAGIVLKYRLPSDDIMKDKKTGPLQDAQRAMRIIRKNAGKWNIDASKIGVMGFSAGGHLAATLTTQYDKKVYDAQNISARPDFSILAYPVISMQDSLTHMGSRKNLLGDNPSQKDTDEYSNELHVTENTPPCFLIHSSDDGTVNYLNSVLFYEALIRNHIPSEMHIFPFGGHGYGLATRKNGPKIWPSNLEDWFKRLLY